MRLSGGLGFGVFGCGFGYGVGFFLRRGWLRCIFVTLPQWLVVIHLRLVLLCVLYLRRWFLIGRHFFAFGFGFGVDFVLRLFLRFSCMCLLMLFAVSIAAAKCVAILSQLLFLGGWGGCLFGH